MTALSRYQRLECGGLWRPAPEAQRREVVIAFGKASLVMTDSRSGTPLAHWSLPAVRRLNPGAAPAVFSPDADAGETLEIEDPDMIAALETVAQALRRGRAGRPRLRLALVAGALAGLGLIALLWLPGALVAHALRVLPPSKQAEIGAAVLADMARAGHPGCGAPLGLRALGRLQERLGAGRVRLVVLAGDNLPPAVALPGGVVALGQPMIEAHDTPDVAAGHVLAALAAAQQEDPLAAALRAAGPWATAVLLTTGEVSTEALRGHGAARLRQPPPSPDPQRLATLFASAGLSPVPYAATRPEAEAAPLQAAATLAPLPAPALLSDAEWVSLQEICLR